ncbi:histone-lysine N-methyltransferase set-1-like [Lampris incognitus]|uniref:histone-lysine N-methyltransferase set-1-like n=1 Tax=Lampris incognitus TaxID=2546036 RepID=UPI0024B5CC2E|nr:histone-lysine N-methyltransferase set-1-like [Lampris incognitus]
MRCQTSTRSPSRGNQPKIRCLLPESGILSVSQLWKGLEIKSIPDKGRGVFTRRAFKMGEVVCDYHGDLLTAAQGQAVHESTIGEETGYMYFFLNEDGEKMCIDAHQKCQCHPDIDVKGRLINHSRKPNLKPLSKRLDLDGDKRDYILFVAKQDISEGEELTFDYGVNKFQFGEARDLDWL